jgi:rhomboid family GlyGly-CTERM serine protease
VSASRVPWFSWAVAAAAALASLDPAGFELTRGGLRDGELWRLWTGHLSHYSAYHLAVDAGTFLLLGLLYERRYGTLRWALMTGVAALAVSLVFVTGERGFDAYRGLSGLDCAAFAAALTVEAPRRKIVAGLMGALFAAKLIWEQASGGFLFPSAELGSMGLPIPSAHTIGAAAGLGMSILTTRPGPIPGAAGASAACGTGASGGDAPDRASGGWGTRGRRAPPPRPA